MTNHETHANHAHTHAAGCGHTAILHAGHVDYLHDGHLHQSHEGHVDECRIDASGVNPTGCTPDHACGGHPAPHTHGPDCGHEAVRHADHIDYWVSGHLHHVHDGHCDSHGVLAAA